MIGPYDPGKPTSRDGMSTGFRDQQSTVKPGHRTNFVSGTRFGGSSRERHFAPKDSRIALSAVANLERGFQDACRVQISAPEIKTSLNGVNGHWTTQSPSAQQESC